jgi:GMP synthase-like glutamine amidotransferase
MTRRIAILNNNTDTSAFSKRFADDGEKVAAGLRAQRPDWTYEVWHARDDELPPEPDHYQGWVLTGSVASVNDGAPWMARLAELVRHLHRRQVPLVGLCFGHQMVAHALGGRVGASPGGWRIGSAATHYRAELYAALSWMQPSQATITLFAAHQEQVLQPPPEAQVLGGDPFAPAAALLVGTHIFTTQYHPELSREFMLALLDEYATLWPAPLVAQARQQVQQPVDATLFMRWAAQFLEQTSPDEGHGA